MLEVAVIEFLHRATLVRDALPFASLKRQA